MLGGELAVLQAPMLDGLSLDPFTLLDDALRPAEVGEVGLPHLVRPAGPGVELIGGLDHEVGRAGDQVVGLEQPVNRGFRHEVALFVGEAHGQFAGLRSVASSAISTIWSWMSSPMRFHTRLGAEGLSSSASGPPSR